MDFWNFGREDFSIIHGDIEILLCFQNPNYSTKLYDAFTLGLRIVDALVCQIIIHNNQSLPRYQGLNMDFWNFGRKDFSIIPGDIKILLCFQNPNYSTKLYDAFTLGLRIVDALVCQIIIHNNQSLPRYQGLNMDFWNFGREDFSIIPGDIKILLCFQNPNYSTKLYGAFTLGLRILMHLCAKLLFITTSRSCFCEPINQLRQ